MGIQLNFTALPFDIPVTLFFVFGSLKITPVVYYWLSAITNQTTDTVSEFRKCQVRLNGGPRRWIILYETTSASTSGIAVTKLLAAWSRYGSLLAKVIRRICMPEKLTKQRVVFFLQHVRSIFIGISKQDAMPLGFLMFSFSKTKLQICDSHLQHRVHFRPRHYKFLISYPHPAISGAHWQRSRIRKTLCSLVTRGCCAEFIILQQPNWLMLLFPSPMQL